MKKILCILITLIFFSVENLFAACTGESPTWYCTTDTCPTQVEVNACISGATSGNTINIAAGTYTWTSYVTIPADKTIKLIGAGSSLTIINSETMFVNMYSDNSRLSGFRFNRLTGGTDATFVEVRGVGFRIDHNYMDDANYETYWSLCVGANAANTTYLPEGVVDSNYLNHCKVGTGGSTNFTKDNGFWAEPSVIGTPKTVYFEDNTIDRGNVNSDIVDSNYAGSYVVRYNNLTLWSNVQAHSLQGPTARGTKSWEIYGNKFTYPTGGGGVVAFLRGGTGMVYNNYVTGGYSTYYIDFDNMRSFTAYGTNPSSGKCDGTSNWDGNVLENGWPCRDQIGRGPDTGTDESAIGKATSSEPAYVWMNKRSTGVTISARVVNGTGDWIAADRDYYNYSASFNRSSGVGCGTLANRPATCTTGVAYWATNQSCFDLTPMVGANPSTPISGTLYKCTSTDTWEAYYTPYTYPHPLRVQKFTGNIMIGGAGLFN